MSPADEIAEHVQNSLSTGDCILVVVAGPNGAGKSTFGDRFLRSTGLSIVNPDDIARALAPGNPGRLALLAIETMSWSTVRCCGGRALP